MTTNDVIVENSDLVLTIEGRVIVANFTGKVECGEFVRAVWYRLDGKLLSFNDITCNKPDCTIMRFELNATIPAGPELTKALADVQDAIVTTLAGMPDKLRYPEQVRAAIHVPRQGTVDLRNIDVTTGALVSVE